MLPDSGVDQYAVDVPEDDGASDEAEQDAAAKAAQARADALSAIEVSVLRHRDDAVSGRRSSGIEDIWLEDEEMYEGIDAANRHEEGYNKSRQFEFSMSGGPSAVPDGASKPTGNRSTVLLNIARRYADAFSARVSDMLMPTDDRAFAVLPTPLGDNAPTEAAALAEHKAVKKAEADAVQEWIDDRLVECDWHGQMRSAIDDASRCGSGVIKGPTPANRKRIKWENQPDGTRKLSVSVDIAPESKRISFWDFFPDKACGDNIHKGSFTCERDRWTRKTLTDLTQMEGWEGDAIEACLKEGPKSHTDVGNDLARNFEGDGEQEQFEVWHYYGSLDRASLETIGCDCGEGDVSVVVPIMAILCNDRIIKVAVNALDTGSFPYDVLPCSQRAGMPWGRGIVRQVRTPQRIITGAIRNLMDNAGLSAGIILFLRRLGITPADGTNDYTLTPGKTFFINDEAKASDAVTWAEIPSRQVELMAIIDFGLRMAEDVTGMPMLMQGQHGTRAPDTVGVATIQNNNANAVLRRMAKLVDSQVTEPHIGRYYDWIQQHGPKELQGDFKIDARGSSALVERDIQNQGVLAMASFVNDREYRIKKDKWFAEWSKSQRLDPKRFQYTDDEWEEEQKNRQPPPEAPAVQAARIREEGATKRQSEKLASDQEIAIIKLLGEENLTTAQIKQRLLEIVTTDRRERDLFVAQRAVKERFGEGVDLPG
jgi:hypothetical protein